MNQYINNIVKDKEILNDIQSEINIKENNFKEENKLALNLILKYYKVTLLTDSCIKTENIEHMIDNLLIAKGLSYRSIILKNDWYKNSMGAMIGRMRTGETIVFIPNTIWGYSYINCKTKKMYKITKKSAELFDSEAFSFNKSLPKVSINTLDFFKYILKEVPSQKYIMLFLSYLVVTLLGLALPQINQYIFSDIIYNSSYKALLTVSYVLVGITVVTTLFTIISRSIVYNIRTTISVTTQNALMDRVLSLPVSFFKEYSSGDITKRLQSFISVVSQMIDTILITVLTVIFSLVYILQIIKITPTLSIPASIITLVMVSFIVVFITIQIPIYIKLSKNDIKITSTFFSLLSGIQKIKLARAEERAFNYWDKKYKKSAELLYNPPFILKIQPYFSLIASYVTTIILYYIAANANISVASFMSFTVAFGMVTSSLASLSDVAIVFAQFYSTIKLLKPILFSIPNSDDNNKITKKLSGNVELKNICFKYNIQNKNILENFSLKIPTGHYIAITGPTGCGKSTLLRLLLGFDISQCGSITYDNVNIKDMNLRTLRKQIGTVLQDGKLLIGSIFENITFFDPELTIEDAWKAAEIAGIAADIRNMPMSMFTVISDGDGSISGGQRQRILIARAIVSQPKILILDEATSSLDNITQQKLIHSLEKLDCTKIVVAHRLSTLQLCEKIIMLNNGEIIEEGTYKSLIEKKGVFYEFVLRQQSYSTDIN